MSDAELAELTHADTIKRIDNMIEGLEQDKLSGARSVSLEFRTVAVAESTPPDRNNYLAMEPDSLRRMS